jgi:ATP-dependent RNA helicase DDX46/PRP5
LEDYVHRVGRTGRAGNKGTAVTFITHEECTLAGDVIKALESAGCEVTDELRDLDDMYHDRLADGDIEKRRSNIGYLGTGHKFTAEEDKKVKDQRQLSAQSLGFISADFNDQEEGEDAEAFARKLL